MAIDPTLLSGLTVNIATEYGVVIDPEMVDATIDVATPVMDRIELVRPNFVKNRPAAIFGTLDSLDWDTGGKASFTVGGDPYDIAMSRSLDSIVKKSYGGSAGIADVDNISSAMPGAPISINRENFANDAAMLLNLLYVWTRRGIDRDTVLGDTGTDAESFDGLETLITSATVDSSFYIDADGAAFDPGMVNEAVLQMMVKGVYPTALYCNPVIHMAISNAYEGRSGVQISMPDANNNLDAGVWVTRITTPAGTLPIVSDPFFTIDDATAPTYTGDIRLMTERHAGVPLVYYEWQVPLSAIPLSKVMGRGRATSTEMAIWGHLALVERTGGAAHGLIENVAVTAESTWSNPTA